MGSHALLMLFRELGQNASTQRLGVESTTLKLLIELLNRENSDKIRVFPSQKGKIQETSQKGGPQNVRVGHRFVRELKKRRRQRQGQRHKSII